MSVINKNNKTDNNSKLTNNIINAITHNNADELERLINICDLLHRGMPNYMDTYKSNSEIYTINDIPTDQLYEEAKDKLKQLRLLSIALTVPDQDSITDKIQKRKQDNTLLYMDGIQAPTEVPTIDNVIIMPKFDGCSIGVELVRQSDKQFIISFAHTRGSDNLTGSRKCQNKTELIQQVFNLNNFNKLINNYSKPFELTYKDESQIGNNNPCLTTTININEVDKIVLRGEFVNNNKNILPDGITTNIGLAAGTINSDEAEYIDYLTFEPFEISNITVRQIRKDDKVNTVKYIPTHISTVKFMKIFGLITYPLINMKHIDNKTDMEKIYNYFLTKCTQPLDGVVYCKSLWTYPKVIEETSKRVNYGKYKWKPHNTKHSTVTDINYSIGKTGRIVPTVIFDEVVIGDKKYTKAKTTFSKLKEYGIDEDKFGIGLVCEIELKQNINPYIANIMYDEDDISEIINIPTICPYCGNPLSWTDSNKDLMCTSDTCQGINIERTCDFLKQIGYKGISTKTCWSLGLYDGNDNHKFDMLYKSKLHKEITESGVAVKQSIRYRATSKQNSKSTTKTKHETDFDTIITNISLGDFLLAISMFTKKKCDDWFTANKITRAMKLIDFINNDDNIKLLNTNYFINDVIEVIKNNCC